MPAQVPTLEEAPLSLAISPKPSWGGGQGASASVTGCSSALQDTLTLLHWMWSSVCFGCPQDAALNPRRGGGRSFGPSQAGRWEEAVPGIPSSVALQSLWPLLRTREGRLGMGQNWDGGAPCQPPIPNGFCKPDHPQSSPALCWVSGTSRTPSASPQGARAGSEWCVFL